MQERGELGAGSLSSLSRLSRAAAAFSSSVARRPVSSSAAIASLRSPCSNAGVQGRGVNRWLQVSRRRSGRNHIPHKQSLPVTTSLPNPFRRRHAAAAESAQGLSGRAKTESRTSRVSRSASAALRAFSTSSVLSATRGALLPTRMRPAQEARARAVLIVRWGRRRGIAEERLSNRPGQVVVVVDDRDLSAPPFGVAPPPLIVPEDSISFPEDVKLEGQGPKKERNAFANADTFCKSRQS